MTNPTLNAALDKSTYKPGDQMTLTVTYSDPNTRPVKVTVTVSDTSGNKSAPVAVTAILDPSTVSVVDDSARVWARQSDTGTVAVYTATA